MKKIALVAGGLVVTNVLANITIDAIRRGGGSFGAALFIYLPYLVVPAPLYYLDTSEENAA